jgi:hypothetical protein
LGLEWYSGFWSKQVILRILRPPKPAGSTDVGTRGVRGVLSWV